MSERKKKTGDVVGWFVLDVKQRRQELCESRASARQQVRFWDDITPEFAPHRIAKVVLAK